MKLSGTLGRGLHRAARRADLGDTIATLQAYQRAGADVFCEDGTYGFLKQAVDGSHAAGAAFEG